MRMSENAYKFIFTSLTRIADFKDHFIFEHIPRVRWRNGDYVVGEVMNIAGSSCRAELPNGRMMELMKGDVVIGALGVRHATLEATGSWEEVTDDGEMHLLTGAGLLGKMTSRSIFVTPLIELQYRGHVLVDEQTKNMLDYVDEVPDRFFDIPVILMVGTSMSSGKTTSARIITRQLKQMGLKVAGAKFTGAGRYRDILSMKDAGADYVVDFVDVGLPSSICPKAQYKEVVKKMVSLLASSEVDVAVVEIGASPLEPYNGAIAIKAIKKQVKCTVLCASDPYAVLGVMKSFRLKPTIVSGPAANTFGGVELIKNLCGIDALNLIEQRNLPALRDILQEKLDIKTFSNN
jgi:hypothetical protein